MSSAKLTWIRDLEVGDSVCDCRYMHLRVVSLEEMRYPPNWLTWFPRKFLPWKLFDLSLWFINLFTRLYPVGDKDVVLEDGAHCSLLHCCDPIDHREEHPLLKT